MITRHAALVIVIVVALVGCAKTPSADGGSTSATSADEGCPKDLLAARGAPCTAQGKTCRAGPGEFTHLLMCSGGKWTEMEAPPPPPPPIASTPKAWDVSCTKDDDCVVVRAAGCCPSPCPAGVVNRRDQERVEADLAAACKKESPHPCPSAGACRGHSILCENHKCGVFYQGDPGYRQPKP